MYYVQDLESAIEFYTKKLGLRLIEKFEYGFALIAADDNGNTIGLMSAQHMANDGEEGSGHLRPRLVFRVDDIDAQYAEFEATGVRVGPLTGKKGETRSAHFYDIDGNPFFMWEDGA